MRKALYRAYRPMTFDQVRGQSHITEVLKNQVNNHKLAHAYLFSGTRGTGKTSCAKILSRAVNCLNPKEGNPCNVCENCLSIIEETTMDVVEMDAASNRRIDDIRELRDKVIYPPTKLTYKVYIIDEAHMITNEGFNALLKIMEEPPSHLIFILATTELEKIPSTILSRTQRYEFKRIGEEDIESNLRAIVTDLDKTMDDDAISAIARRADGAMRDGLSLLDQITSAEKDHLTIDDVNAVLGTVDQQALFHLVDAVLNRDGASVLDQLERVMAEGKDVSLLIKELIYHYRTLMMIKATRSSQLTDLDEDNALRYSKQSAELSSEDVVDSLDILMEYEERMRKSDYGQTLLEVCLIRLVDRVDRSQLISRVRALENAIKKGVVYESPTDKGLPIGREARRVEPKTEFVKPSVETPREKTTIEQAIEAGELKERPSPPAKGDGQSIDALLQTFDRDLEIELKSVSPFAYDFLKLASSHEIIDNIIHYRFSEADSISMNMLAKHTEVMGNSFSKVLQRPVQVVLEKEQPSKPPSNQDLDKLIELVGQDNITFTDKEK